MMNDTTSDVDEPLLLGSPGRWACSLAEGIVEGDDLSGQEERVELQETQRKLWFALVLAIIFMVVEIVGGIYSGSLAILTDAAHLLSDVGGFAVALVAATWAAKRSSESFSFGNHRLEVLGALASVLSVWGVTVVLVYEAILRLLHPEPVNGKAMTVLAAIGVLVNIALLGILGGHHHHHHHHSGHEHVHNRSDHALEGVGIKTSQVASGADIDSMEEGVGGKGVKEEEAASLGSGKDDKVGEGTSQLSVASKSRGIESIRGPDDINEVDKFVPVASASGLGLERAATSMDRTHGVDEAGKGNGIPSGESNMNIRGAAIHVLGDLLQSVGVAVAGIIIWWHQGDPRWAIADPICTFIFACLVLTSTWTILRDVGDILMERAPPGLRDVAELSEKIRNASGGVGVHDLHIWSLKPSVVLLCAHIVVRDREDSENALEKATLYCRRELGVQHTTFQIVVDSRGGCPCGGGSSVTSSHTSSRTASRSKLTSCSS